MARSALLILVVAHRTLIFLLLSGAALVLLLLLAVTLPALLSALSALLALAIVILIGHNFSPQDARIGITREKRPAARSCSGIPAQLRRASAQAGGRAGIVYRFARRALTFAARRSNPVAQLDAPSG